MCSKKNRQIIACNLFFFLFFKTSKIHVIYTLLDISKEFWVGFKIA